MDRHNKIKKGFTLIELLIVVAILAILISILVPALHNAKAQAKYVMCKTNLMGYGKMAFVYMGDNKEEFPNPWTSFYSKHQFPQELNGTYHRYCRWHNPAYDLELHPEFAGPFWKYLKGKKIHLCPTFTSDIALKFGPRHPEHVPSIPIVPNYSYSMNGYLGDKKISGIKYLDQVFFFAEENLWITSPYNSYAFNDTAFCSYGDGWGYGQGDCFGTFHLAESSDLEDGVANAVFLDGHVQSVRREDTWRLTAPDGFKYSPLEHP
ncbi:MAG: type II secretion system protein [Sedimentisphaerales bacterium]|nr:type II secretion system protein [Sedimentisphaerales bacterium]